MSTNVPQNQDDQEIDLFLILKKIGNFPKWISAMLFKSIQFFIKNRVLLVILFILGFGLGLYLDNTQKTYKHQIIVEPNFESTDHLYSKIDLIESKIEENDVVFLKGIGIQNPSKISGIKIEPIVDIYKFINSNRKNIELLQLMAQNGDLKTIIKESTTSKNYNYHTIIISSKDTTTKNDFVAPILNYLNTSSYYSKIKKITTDNIRQNIKEKEKTITQIDQIVTDFSNKKDINKTNNNLVYYNENSELNSIIRTKDSLVTEIGLLKIDLFNSNKIINDNAVVLNIKNNKSINGKLKFILPFTFLVLFISFRFFMSFYRKQTLLLKEVA